MVNKRYGRIEDTPTVSQYAKAFDDFAKYILKADDALEVMKKAPSQVWEMDNDLYSDFQTNAECILHELNTINAVLFAEASDENPWLGKFLKALYEAKDALLELWDVPTAINAKDSELFHEAKETLGHMNSDIFGIIEKFPEDTSDDACFDMYEEIEKL